MRSRDSASKYTLWGERISLQERGEKVFYSKKRKRGYALFS